MHENLSVYVHWPFCISKCPYCDFNSYASKVKEFNDWIDAYTIEIQNMSRIVGKRKVKTIYFGGGTPSLMHPEDIKRIIHMIFDNFNSDEKDCEEITIEINPCTVDFGKLKGFFDAGINRVSIGLQSINNERLKILKRTHNAQNAIQVVQWSKEIFDKVSFDMIYGVPGQSLLDWEKELSEAMHYAAGHLSLYQLHLYEDTPFFNKFKNKTLNDELLSEMYDLTRSIAQSFDMKNYEVSNYALPGHEGKHNLCYWKCEDYLGIGPGAHGRIRLKNQYCRFATFNEKLPTKWKNGQSINSFKVTKFDKLSKKDHIEEIIMMGLRLSSGLNIEKINDIIGNEDIFFYINKKKLDEFCQKGIMEMKENLIKVSENYFIVLDYILGEIIT